MDFHPGRSLENVRAIPAVLTISCIQEASASLLEEEPSRRQQVQIRRASSAVAPRQLLLRQGNGILAMVLDILGRLISCCAMALAWPVVLFGGLVSLFWALFIWMGTSILMPRSEALPLYSMCIELVEVIITQARSRHRGSRHTHARGISDSLLQRSTGAQENTQGEGSSSGRILSDVVRGDAHQSPVNPLHEVPANDISREETLILENELYRFHLHTMDMEGPSEEDQMTPVQHPAPLSHHGGAPSGTVPDEDSPGWPLCLSGVQRSMEKATAGNNSSDSQVEPGLNNSGMQTPSFLSPVAAPDGSLHGPRPSSEPTNQEAKRPCSSSPRQRLLFKRAYAYLATEHGSGDTTCTPLLGFHPTARKRKHHTLEDPHANPEVTPPAYNKVKCNLHKAESSKSRLSQRRLWTGSPSILLSNSASTRVHPCPDT